MVSPTRISELSAAERNAVIAELGREALSRCAADGWFWLSFVKTRDEASEDSVKPFPRLPYVQEIWRALDQGQKTTIAKSRQMLVSWLLCAYCVWYARFRANRYVVWQTQKGEDAEKMVCMPGGDKDAGYFARMQFIERTLPSWMRQRTKEGAGMIMYPNGSMIEAVAGGANQVRGKTASLIIEDEFAFQEESRGVWQAVAPLVQKATKFVAVSTPNGPSNIFAELYHGYSLLSRTD